MHRASRSLLRVVETNAEISRNYSGSEKAEPVSTDLVPLVADVADVYAAAAESKGVGFACDLQGMGLGLAMVHSIVMFYHGDIACTSEPGHGTSFVITFPQ